MNMFHHDCLADLIQIRLCLILKVHAYQLLRVTFLICLMHLLNCSKDHVLPAGKHLTL